VIVPEAEVRSLISAVEIVVVAKVVVPVTISDEVAVMSPTRSVLIVPVTASRIDAKKLVEVPLSVNELVA
jgi:homogentisate 1,2-dioxygenase